jgi:hypothetical protein
MTGPGKVGAAMALEYVIYCDESQAKGKYFSNFYGGLLVPSTELDYCRAALQSCKDGQKLEGEVKWQKVTGQYLDKYVTLMDAFFDLIESGRVKMRVMFTQNLHVATGLTTEQKENTYCLLYYQFLKHAFGLQHAGPHAGRVRLRVYLDQMPSTAEAIARFKGYILGLNGNPQFRGAGVYLHREDITEVCSHDHAILQCLDVALGAIPFRLNDLHKEKPAGSRRRGKRTVAKEKLYKHINSRIRRIYPHFNIGASTGTNGDLANRWRHPYRHWKFVPTEHTVDATKAKPK